MGMGNYTPLSPCLDPEVGNSYISFNRLKKTNLVGGFNPFEKDESKWESSPNRGENQKIFETTTYR